MHRGRKGRKKDFEPRDMVDRRKYMSKGLPKESMNIQGYSRTKGSDLGAQSLMGKW